MDSRLKRGWMSLSEGIQLNSDFCANQFESLEVPLPSGDIPDVTLAREDGRDSRGQKVILDPD